MHSKSNLGRFVLRISLGLIWISRVHEAGYLCLLADLEFTWSESRIAFPVVLYIKVGLAEQQ